VELATVLHRSASDRPLPSEVFVRVRAAPRRPRLEFRLRVRSGSHVDRARRHGLALFLLTGDVPTRFHYPMEFPPVLMLDPRLVGVVDSPYRTVAFRSAEALRDPPFEALVTMMLQVDEIAARVMLVRNPTPDPVRLARFVVGERLEAPATMLRFQEFAPGIPAVGEPWPIEALREQEGRNPG
jgi:hypothetical protein